MTDLLKRLLNAYGLLHITIAELEKSRPGTSHASLKEYYDSLGAPLPGEPTLVVKVSGDGETRILRNFTGPDVPSELKDADVTLMELPEDEFHFFQAFRSGLFDLQKEVPAFILEMSLVHAFALFETYVGDIIRLRLKAYPAQLGMSKHVTVADVLASADKDVLLDTLIEREVYQIMHEPLGAILARLRDRLGLRLFDASFDNALVKLSLIRNCLMHNGGRRDPKLAAFDASAPVGAKIVITVKDTQEAVEKFRRAAVSIDAAFVKS